jgi:hypothetical protein
MVALHIGAWTTLILLWQTEGNIRFGGLTVLDWTLLAILIGCVQTIWIRLVRIIRALQRQDVQPTAPEQSRG